MGRFRSIFSGCAPIPLTLSSSGECCAHRHKRGLGKLRFRGLAPTGLAVCRRISDAWAEKARNRPARASRVVSARCFVSHSLKSQSSRLNYWKETARPRHHPTISVGRCQPQLKHGRLVKVCASTRSLSEPTSEHCFAAPLCRAISVGSGIAIPKLCLLH